MISQCILISISPIKATRMVMRERITSVDENVDKLELSYINGRNVKWGNHFRKQFGGVFLKIF